MSEATTYYDGAALEQLIYQVRGVHAARLVTDPGYSSFCDISDTVSCQQVFQSRYGSVAGIPVAAGGAIWSTLVLLLAALGMRQPAAKPIDSAPAATKRPGGVAVCAKPDARAELAGRVAGYIFLLSIVGLAAVFYFGYASFFVLGQACPLCMTIYVAVAGIFLVSAGAATSLTGAASRLGEEFRSGACHAGRYEGSIVLAERPDLVREAIRAGLAPNPASLSRAIRDGRTTFADAGGPRAYFGWPADATGEEGRATIAALGEILADAVDETWRPSRSAT